MQRCSSEGYKCEKIAIEKIKHFVSKEALNIDGLGKKVVEKFWDLKIVRLPQDIFTLNYNKISNLMYIFRTKNLIPFLFLKTVL